MMSAPTTSPRRSYRRRRERYRLPAIRPRLQRYAVALGVAVLSRRPGGMRRAEFTT